LRVSGPAAARRCSAQSDADCAISLR